jgi:hypothetical protein
MGDVVTADKPRSLAGSPCDDSGGEARPATESSVLDERAAARRLCLSVHTLRKWRVAGKGPRFLKLPGAERRGRGRAGLVRYRPADIEAFIAECLVPTQNPMPSTGIPPWMDSTR